MTPASDPRAVTATRCRPQDLPCPPPSPPPASTCPSARAPSSPVSTSTLADGDVTALVGPNGSGKSTLMRILVGDLPVGTPARSGSPRRTRPSPGCRRCCLTSDESLLDYARRRTGRRPRPTSRSSRRPDALAAGRRRGGGGLRHAPSSAGSPSVPPTSSTGCPRWPHRVGLTRRPDRPLGSLSGGEAARASLGRPAAQPVRPAAARRADQRPRRAAAWQLVAEFVLAHSRAGARRQPRPRASSTEVATERRRARPARSSGSGTTPAPSPTTSPPVTSRAAQAWEAYAGVRRPPATPWSARRGSARSGRRRGTGPCRRGPGG